MQNKKKQFNTSNNSLKLTTLVDERQDTVEPASVSYSKYSVSFSK